MKHWMIRSGICLFLGFMLSVFIMYNSEFDYATIENGPSFYLILQTLSFSAVFLAIYLLIQYMIMMVQTKEPVPNIEKIGVLFQVISIVVIFLQYSLIPVGFSFFGIGFVLIIIGVISYRQNKSIASISFMLWGIAIILWLLTMASGSSVTWEVR